MRPVRLLLVLALVLAAAPAAADHGDIHPTKRTERTYFKCLGSNKVQNVDMAQGTMPTWSTTAPTQSVQQGAGCGTADTGVTNANQENAFDGVWKGTFTGNVDSITVEAHAIDSTPRATGSHPILAILTVDGEQLLPQTRIVPTTVRSSTQASSKLTFSITGLPYLTEDGDGTAVRTFTLSLKSYADYPAAWVWDTTEVPSGITFNPATLESVQVPVAY